MPLLTDYANKQGLLMNICKYLIALFIFILPLDIYSTDNPPMQLASHYSDPVDVSNFYVSEKLDGVRGYWDGQQLLTRGGNKIAAPAWFIAQMPLVAVEGELWIGRGEFERVSSIVRQQHAEDADWHVVNFMLFDLPHSDLPFEQRYQQMLSITQGQSHVNVIEQFSVANIESLHQHLARVTALGGEGLMLHDKRAIYQVGRSTHIMKLKPKYDAEAQVMGYTEGKGKYQNMVGALIVALPDGRTFKIGSGLSDDDRRQPPPVGSIITYQYLGFTKNGIPRFATFKRKRHQH